MTWDDWDELKAIIYSASALKNQIVSFNAKRHNIQIESGQALLVKNIEDIADHWAFDVEHVHGIKILKLYDISLMEADDEALRDTE